jgi:hypothetical protein
MAQLSPGDLTSVHADLEGMFNCTQCHILGKKVSNDKCLECHKEINSLIREDAGYHASSEVKGKDCAQCHSEHHGRNFDMIHFDEDNFDHDLAGYKLTGQHQQIDCRKCHMPDLIADSELKRRKETFLGLEQECIACHADYHQKTLSNECSKCHTTDAFSPAYKFDHNQTDFPLLGSHKVLECSECHAKETRNGKDFQRFAGTEFTNCNSCHADAHSGHLGTDCKQCHNEESFQSTGSLKRFDHRITGFPLKGRHQEINCSACHNLNADPQAIFQEKRGVQSDNCAACHEDVHDNRFGNKCAECHNEKSFLVDHIENFNHSLTDFELMGKHQTVDCRQCHTESFSTPMPHNTCAACHSDYHDGQLTQEPNTTRDCAECHTVDGFDYTLFTIEDHNTLSFPLEGAHLATPCFACHVAEDKWSFRNIGQRCVDCHADVHQGFISEQYYPLQACQNCHTPESWPAVIFDHGLTGFELQGKHREVACMACHVSDDEQAAYSGFTDLSPACINCHENVHGDQFELNGTTDCARCHGFENWSAENFNHDNTAFKLEGRHAEVECSACHQVVGPDGSITMQYKFTSFKCVDCHL